VQYFVLLCDIAYYNYTKDTRKSQKPQRVVFMLLYYRGIYNSIMLAKVKLVILNGVRCVYEKMNY